MEWWLQVSREVSHVRAVQWHTCRGRCVSWVDNATLALPSTSAWRLVGTTPATPGRSPSTSCSNYFESSLLRTGSVEVELSAPDKSPHTVWQKPTLHVRISGFRFTVGRLRSGALDSEVWHFRSNLTTSLADWMPTAAQRHRNVGMNSGVNRLSPLT